MHSLIYLNSCDYIYSRCTIKSQKETAKLWSLHMATSRYRLSTLKFLSQLRLVTADSKWGVNAKKGDTNLLRSTLYASFIGFSKMDASVNPCSNRCIFSGTLPVRLLRLFAVLCEYSKAVIDAITALWDLFTLFNPCI